MVESIIIRVEYDPETDSRRLYVDRWPEMAAFDLDSLPDFDPQYIDSTEGYAEICLKVENGRALYKQESVETDPWGQHIGTYRLAGSVDRG